METTAFFVIAYLATGIALIGYDFAAPPTHKKDYVSEGRVSGALATWFFWPATVFKDSHNAIKAGRAGMRYALGVTLLFIVMFFITNLFFHFVAGPSILAYLGCFVIVVVLSPFLAALVLPGHDKY